MQVLSKLGRRAAVQRLAKTVVLLALPNAMRASEPAAGAGVLTPEAKPEANPAVALVRFLLGVQSFQARFEHEQRSPSGGRLVFKGQVWMRRPARLRWQIEKPYKQLHLLNGREFWFYDEGLEQLTKRDLDAGVESTPAGLLMAAGPEAGKLLDKRFKFFNLPETTEGLQWARLVPKTKGGGGVTEMVVGMGPERGEPRVLRLTDSLGRNSVVRFSEITINGDIPASRFEFQVPPGTEVIRG